MHSAADFDCSVDSSSRFLYGTPTERQTDKLRDETDHPTRATATVGVDNDLRNIIPSKRRLCIITFAYRVIISAVCPDLGLTDCVLTQKSYAWISVILVRWKVEFRNSSPGACRAQCGVAEVCAVMITLLLVSVVRAVD